MEGKRIIATVINDLHFDQRMIRICSALSEQGYQVTLVGRKLSKNVLPDQRFDQKRFRFLINSGPLFYLLYNMRLFLYLAFKRFDYVHAVDLDSLGAAFLATRLKGKKLVYDAHEYFTEVPELVDRPLKKGLWKKLEALLVPKVDAALTVGEAIAELYLREYGKSFHVVRNVSASSDIPDVEHEEKFILYQGALNKGRGLEILIEAMTELPVDLVIAGSGDLDDELRQKVVALDLSDKVKFTGMLPPDALRALTQKAWLGFNVSENLGLSYYYSLNNKFFDYIHAGLPALTNNFPEYIKLNTHYDCCVLCEHTYTDIVQSILLLLNDPERYDLLKKNCFLAMRELNWEEEKKKLYAVYASIT